MILREAWADFRKVPADWARASMVSVWEVVLDAVQILLDWVST
jgi:hypothetical protein